MRKPEAKHEYRVYHNADGEVVGFGELSEVMDQLGPGRFAITGIEAVTGRRSNDKHVQVSKELVDELKDKPDKMKTMKVKDGQVV